MSNNNSDNEIIYSDDSNSNESDNFQDLLKVYQKEIKNQKKQSLQIPKEISQLMGQANNYYMQKNYNMATEKLNEVIRQCPNFSEPYHILGLMQEQKFDIKKAVHFYTIAAELQQNDSELWQKIGFLHKQVKNYEQAQYCFGRCIKKDPLNLLVLQERAQCFEKIGDFKKSIKNYLKLIQLNPDDKKLIKQVANLCAKNQQTEKSKELLFPLIYQNNQIDFEVLHNLCQIHILDKQFDECLELLNQVQNNENLPAEIIINLAICYSNLNFNDQAKFYIKKLLNFNAQEYADLYMKAIELLEQKNDYQGAFEICDQLLTEQKYQDYKTFLKFGKLYQKLQDYDSAIDVYKVIIENNPQIYEAQQELCNIYNKKGQNDQALNVLEQNYKAEQYDEDEIFLSSEEGDTNTVVKQESPKIKKKIKLEYKSQDQEVNFKDQIDKELLQTQQKYDSQQLIFFYSQSKQQLENSKYQVDIEMLDKVQQNLINILQFENEIQKIKKRAMNRYLFESRKKGFAKKIKNQGQPYDQPSIILNKNSQKMNNQEDNFFFKKSKIKLSKNLTDLHFINVQYITKIESENTLLDYILKLLEQNKLTNKIYKICWECYKLDYLKQNKLQYDQILQFGVVSSLEIQKYNKAFQYFKHYVKKNQQSCRVATIFAQIVYKIKDQDTYRTFLSKLGQSSNLGIQQLTGYSYMKHSYFDLAIQKFKIIQDKDPQNALINLMIGVCYLQSAISRSTDDKQNQLQQAFEYIQQYVNLRQKINLAETYYNMGRAFAQISNFIQAINFFEQTILECQFQDKFENISKKAAYNLFYIHKNMGNIQMAKQISKNYL